MDMMVIFACLARLDFSLQQLMFFFFNDTATTEIYTLSLHDALPIYVWGGELGAVLPAMGLWGTKLAQDEGSCSIRLATGAIRSAELHWYEAHGIGRKGWKIKRFFS